MKTNLSPTPGFTCKIQGDTVLTDGVLLADFMDSHSRIIGCIPIGLVSSVNEARELARSTPDRMRREDDIWFRVWARGIDGAYATADFFTAREIMP